MPGVTAILALMGPAVIAASTTQVNVLINSMFASTLGDGAIFWLAIAFRLMQLPLGLFGVALGTVTLPLLSRFVVAGQMEAFRGELARALRLMFLLTIPSTIGLMMLAEPIISVLYQHGRFERYEAAQAAGALRFYAVGLAGYAALKVLVNAFYALDRRKTPMLVSFLAVGLNLLFNWFFTFRLGWGHRGLAFSTGCVATCNLLLLYVLMHGHLGGLESRRMFATLAKIAVAGSGARPRCAPPPCIGCSPTGPVRSSGTRRSRCLARFWRAAAYSSLWWPCLESRNSTISWPASGAGCGAACRGGSDDGPYGRHRR